MAIGRGAGSCTFVNEIAFFGSMPRGGSVTTYPVDRSCQLPLQILLLKLECNEAITAGVSKCFVNNLPQDCSIDTNCGTLSN